MHWADWIIVTIPLALVAIIGLYARRYVRSVADFLAAGRVAGRYVVCVASAEAGVGLISVIALMEKYYAVGFAINFWASIATPIGIVLLLTGFAIYRYRETRAMTLAQFFEVRYSKSFRFFAGVLQSLCGIINYGLFPAVGARFLIYYCSLPMSVEFLGLTWPTFALLMAGFLTIAVLIVTLGGQITAMTTDCVQGILSYPMYLIVVAAILWEFSWWDEMAPTLLDRGDGQSMLDPFDTHKLRDFNLFFVFVGFMGSIYNRLSWSGSQAYHAAAATPHEQKMGAILGTWRSGFSAMMFILLAVAAYTYLHHDTYAGQAAVTEHQLSQRVLVDVVPNEVPAHAGLGFQLSESEVQAHVDSLNADEAQVYNTIRNQVLVTSALRDILPVGVAGVLCALMIFLLISTDTTYMHSWGSILIQDVVLPFRKRAFSPRQHLALLRSAIVFVAIFAFCFSLFYGQVTYILMFFALTGSVWLGGAGAVIIGGLYWKRGTTAGAWAALLTGSSLAVLGFIGLHYWAGWIYPALTRLPWLLDWTTFVVEGVSAPFEPIILWRVHAAGFPLNGQEIYFVTMVSAIVMYVVTSLLTCREPFNMQRMLHRGEYSRPDERPDQLPREAAASLGGRGAFQNFQRLFMGIDEQFTRGDKIISWSVFCYSMGWGFLVWLAIVVWNVFFGKWTQEGWALWFFIQNIVVASAIGVVSTVWFMWGGIRDLLRMFRRLSTLQRNELDDGRVMGHINADDLERVAAVEHDVVTRASDSEAGAKK